MPTVRANGLDQHYVAEGGGPPLVLLHGATSSATEDWAAQRPLFRKAFRLYLVDARGHAGTRAVDEAVPRGRAVSGAGTGPASPDGTPPGSGDLADVLVDDLAGFADALGLTTFHLAGFSLGAMTALRFASRYPGRLRTLVLVGVDIEHEPSASVTRALMDPDRVEREDPAWAEQLERRHGPVQGAGAWRALLATIVREVERRRRLSPDELRAARVPTLVVGGDRDVFVPAAHLVALYRQLPDAQLLVVPDCGHQVMAARPGLFNEAAGGFYRATAEVAGRRAAAGPGAAADILRPAAGAAGRGIGPVPSTAPETATVATPVRGGAA